MFLCRWESGVSEAGVAKMGFYGHWLAISSVDNNDYQYWAVNKFDAK